MKIWCDKCKGMGNKHKWHERLMKWELDGACLSCDGKGYINIDAQTTNYEIVFYALKQLEAEIELAKRNKNYSLQNELEIKYSYWKQLM